MRAICNIQNIDATVAGQAQYTVRAVLDDPAGIVVWSGSVSPYVNISQAARSIMREIAEAIAPLISNLASSETGQSVTVAVEEIRFTPGDTAVERRTRLYGWQRPSDTSATGIINVNLAVGPTTVTGATAVVNDATGQYTNYATSAVNGNVAGVRGPYSLTQRQAGPLAYGAIKTPVLITSERLWFGLCSGDPSGAADPAGLHLAAFRFDTGAGDTEFMACTKDGTTLTATPTGIAPVVDARYEWDVDLFLDGFALFYLQRKLVTVISTTLPGSATGLGQAVTCTTLSAAIRTIRWSHTLFNSK
jgi:hypothetical protein